MHLNLARVYQKLSNYEEVIKCCNQALSQNSSKDIMGKGRYLRGRAYLQLKDYEKAHADLKEAYSISPDDASIGRLLREARAGIESDRKKEASLWGGKLKTTQVSTNIQGEVNNSSNKDYDASKIQNQSADQNTTVTISQIMADNLVWFGCMAVLVLALVFALYQWSLLDY